MESTHGLTVYVPSGRWFQYVRVTVERHSRSHWLVSEDSLQEDESYIDRNELGADALKTRSSTSLAVILNRVAEELRHAYMRQARCGVGSPFPAMLGSS